MQFRTFLSTTPNDSPVLVYIVFNGVNGRCERNSACSWQSAKGKQKKCTQMSFEKPGTHWPDEVMPNSEAGKTKRKGQSRVGECGVTVALCVV
jgi:hypothetical protein